MRIVHRLFRSAAFLLLAACKDAAGPPGEPARVNLVPCQTQPTPVASASVGPEGGHVGTAAGDSIHVARGEPLGQVTLRRTGGRYLRVEATSTARLGAPELVLQVPPECMAGRNPTSLFIARMVEGSDTHGTRLRGTVVMGNRVRVVVQGGFSPFALATGN